MDREPRDAPGGAQPREPGGMHSAGTSFTCIPNRRQVVELQEERDHGEHVDAVPTDLQRRARAIDLPMGL
eukprot:7488467-Pyramimonas_sp.AAC.1